MSVAHDEMMKVLNCLYIAVEADVAADVGQKVMAAMDEKDKEIAKLKKTWEHSAEANREWLAAFDKYRQRIAEQEKESMALAEQLLFQRTLEGKVIAQQQRIAEARKLIRNIGSFEVEFYQDANKWLEGNP